METLKQMLEENQTDVFLHYAIAMEFLSEGALNKAIEKLEYIKIQFPDYLPLYYQLAQLYEKVNQNESAILTYEAGIELAIFLKETKTAGELRSALDELNY